MFRQFLTASFLFLVGFASCQEKKYEFDLQGHRGARGLMPENSIPGFIKALELGVNTLELDLVVTKDGRVLVSHEPCFSPSICLDSTGKTMEGDPERKYNIYNHLYHQTQRYDCGSKYNDRFPEQTKMPTVKPLLSEVIDTVEQFIRQKNRMPVQYNIELKSSPKGDYLLHPSPPTFSDMVYRVVAEKLPAGRVTIQSFDFRVLRYWQKEHPEYPISALVGEHSSVAESFDELGFTPDVYSPYFESLKPASIDTLHQLGVSVVPWTVNKVDDMRELLQWGVDGIITDYPDRALRFKPE